MDFIIVGIILLTAALILLLTGYAFQLSDPNSFVNKRQKQLQEEYKNKKTTDSATVNDSDCGKKLDAGSAKREDEEKPKALHTVQSQTNVTAEFQPLWLLNEHSEGAEKCRKRNLPELMEFWETNRDLWDGWIAGDGIKQMTNDEICSLMMAGKLKAHQLEKELGDELRAVHLRRLWFSSCAGKKDVLDNVPYMNYDYSYVSNSCCENVLGFVPMPLGYAGPLLVNGQKYQVPMATTEGCLVASTNRGCRALQAGEGVFCHVEDCGMTRGPVVRFERALDAVEFKREISTREALRFMKQTFNSTSGYAKLKDVKVTVVGRLVYLRFVATSGDAMGMNMVSKATEATLKELSRKHHKMVVISLSGNYCVDKKPAAINWIEGRGKSVVADAVVAASVVTEVLKSDVDTLVALNIDKNLTGSAVAGALGGFNAHSANIVTAVFLATGQDAAQNISSSNCITLLEKTTSGDLYISCTLPSLEVGTVGGGTILPAQQACLEMLGCAGGAEISGNNSKRLAEILGATVLAGELSLLAALSSGHLVRSHLRYNRSNLNLRKISSAACLDSEVGSASASGLSVFNQLAELSEQSFRATAHTESCSKVLA